MVPAPYVSHQDAGLLGDRGAAVKSRSVLLNKSGATRTFGEDAVIGMAPPMVLNIDTLDEYVCRIRTRDRIIIISRSRNESSSCADNENIP